MTISAEQNLTTIQGNSSSTQFSFSFPADSAADLVVSVTTSGVTTILLPTQYSVLLNPIVTGQLWSVGGVISYPVSGSPLAVGSSLTIQRIIPLQQTYSIANQGDFAPVVTEQALDSLLMQLQQISTRTGSFRGVWQTGTTYNYADIVQDGVNGVNSSNYYLCVLANTSSSSWTTDLAAGDWILIITSAFPNASLPLSIANGGTGKITAAAALAALGGIGLSANNAFTGANSFTGGSIIVPTQGAGDSTTKAASTGFVNGTALTLANGTTAVTQSSSDNTNKLATTSFVQTLTSGGASSIKSVHVQTFTGNGTYTPTTGMAYAIVKGPGPGGGSAGINGSTAIGGAGSGAYLEVLLTAAQVGASKSIVIGTVGTAGTSAPTDGGSGTATSMGSLFSIPGGNGSTSSGPGAATALPTVTVGFPIVALAGQPGNPPFTASGGWGAGMGGSNPLGFGGPSSNISGSSAIPGSQGTGYGSGASGAAANGSLAAGAQGQPSILTILEFCTV